MLLEVKTMRIICDRQQNIMVKDTWYGSRLAVSKAFQLYYLYVGHISLDYIQPILLYK